MFLRGRVVNSADPASPGRSQWAPSPSRNCTRVRRRKSPRIRRNMVVDMVPDMPSALMRPFFGDFFGTVGDARARGANYAPRFNSYFLSLSLRTRRPVVDSVWVMPTAPANYEQQVADGVRRRVEAFDHIAAAEARVEGEFPQTLLLVKVRDTRFPGRILGNYSSVWNDDGTPRFSSDPDVRAQFVSESCRNTLEPLPLKPCRRPTWTGLHGSDRSPSVDYGGGSRTRVR